MSAAQGKVRAPEPEHRRTGSRVHAGSRAAAEAARLWRPVDKARKWDVLRAAKAKERATKAKGRRNGALGYAGLRVLEALIGLVDHKTGRLEPTIEYLMEMTRLSRDAVISANRRLRDAGFLTWIRRTVETGLKGLRGPQVQQTSNAYRVELPPDAAQLAPQPAPIPADFATARAAKAAALREMRAEETGLAAALAAIARGLTRIRDPE